MEFPKYSQLKMHCNRKSIFALRSWKKLFFTSPYHNNCAQKLDSRNRINVLCNFSVFAEKYFTSFFPKVNSLKTYCAYFSFGQVEIFMGKQTVNITCPTGKLLKKLISALSLTPSLNLTQNLTLP